MIPGRPALCVSGCVLLFVVGCVVPPEIAGKPSTTHRPRAPVSAPPIPIRPPLPGIMSPRSPPGSLVVKMDRRGFGGRIVTMRPDGSHRRILIRTRGNISSVVWSPDGTQIGFTAGCCGSYNDDAFVMNTDGSELHAVANLPGSSELMTDWSPSMDWILLDRSMRGDRRDIFKIRSDGTGLVRLTHRQSHDFLPDWSPDGRWILFSSDRDTPWGARNVDLYKMRPDGTQVYKLTDSPLRDWGGRWSPNGRRIVYEHGPQQIFTMRSDGTGIRRVTRLHEGGHSPAWSPYGKRIIFTSYWYLQIINTDGTGLRRVTSRRAGCRSPYGCFVADWRQR